METRYWKCNKNLGKFTTKVDESTAGAVKYEHPMIPGGFKWQLEVNTLAGHIESLYIDDSQYGQQLCIGLQNSAGVDVLQVPTRKQNSEWPVAEYAYLAKRIGNFDVDRVLELKAAKFPGKDKDGKPTGYDVFRVFPHQGSRNAVAEYLTRDKQPKIESGTVGSKQVWDTDPLFNALEEQVEAFNIANKGKLDEMRGTREPTKNEVAAQSNDILEDCPF